jgi:hypothetical protein
MHVRVGRPAIEIGGQVTPDATTKQVLQQRLGLDKNPCDGFMIAHISRTSKPWASPEFELRRKN